jgi:hypothetical protein
MKKTFINYFKEFWKIIRGSGINRITIILIIGGLSLVGTPLWEVILEVILNKELDIIIPNRYEPLIGFGLIMLGLFYHYLFHKNIHSNSNPGPVIPRKIKKVESLILIDSFPKDNDTIRKEQVKDIFFKFNKPIIKQSENYIKIKLIRVNSNIQCNTMGWFQREENNTNLIWHIRNELFNKKGYFDEPEEQKEQPVFEIHLGHDSQESRIEAEDNSILPHTIIRVKVNG